MRSEARDGQKKGTTVRSDKDTIKSEEETSGQKKETISQRP